MSFLHIGCTIRAFLQNQRFLANRTQSPAFLAKSAFSSKSDAKSASGKIRAFLQLGHKIRAFLQNPCFLANRTQNVQVGDLFIKLDAKTGKNTKTVYSTDFAQKRFAPNRSSSFCVELCCVGMCWTMFACFLNFHALHYNYAGVAVLLPCGANLFGFTLSFVVVLCFGRICILWHVFLSCRMDFYV